MSALGHIVAHYLEIIVKRAELPGFDEMRAEIESAADADEARRWDPRTSPSRPPNAERTLIATYLLGQMLLTGGTKEAKVAAAVTYADDLLRHLERTA